MLLISLPQKKGILIVKLFLFSEYLDPFNNFRTFRLAVVEGMDFATTSLGNALSGPVFNSVGLTWTFIIGAIITFLGCPYIAFILEESLVKTKNVDEEKEKGDHVIKKAFLFVLEGFKAIVKPREGKRRPFIIMIIFVYTIVIFAQVGAEGPHRIYFAKKKYDWTENELTVFYTINRLLGWLGLWVFVPLMTKGFKLSDCSIAIISALVASLGYFLPIFTGTKKWLTVGSYVLNWYSFSCYLCVLSPVIYITSRYE